MKQFNGKNYPTMTVLIGGMEYEIGTEELSCQLMEDGEFVSNEAEQIDVNIFFYVPDAVMKQGYKAVRDLAMKETDFVETRKFTSNFFEADLLKGLYEYYSYDYTLERDRDAYTDGYCLNICTSALTDLDREDKDGITQDDRPAEPEQIGNYMYEITEYEAAEADLALANEIYGIEFEEM